MEFAEAFHMEFTIKFELQKGSNQIIPISIVADCLSVFEFITSM